MVRRTTLRLLFYSFDDWVSFLDVVLVDFATRKKKEMGKKLDANIPPTSKQ